MKPDQTPQKIIRPLVTAEQMERILSSRRSISSEEAYRQIAEHLGRPNLPVQIRFANEDEHLGTTEDSKTNL